MERVSFTTHRGVRVLEVDYSGLHEVPELLRVAERVCRVVEKEAPDSVLVLVDLSDTRYSLRLVRILTRSCTSLRPRSSASTRKPSPTTRSHRSSSGAARAATARAASRRCRC